MFICLFGQRTKHGTKHGKNIFIVTVVKTLAARKDGNDKLNTLYLWLLWHQTYGKGPFRKQERKPTAATWATLFNYQMCYTT